MSKSWTYLITNYLTGNVSVPPALVFQAILRVHQEVKERLIWNISRETSRSFDQMVLERRRCWTNNLSPYLLMKKKWMTSPLQGGIPVCRKFTSTVAALQSFFQISRRTKPQDLKASPQWSWRCLLPSLLHHLLTYLTKRSHQAHYLQTSSQQTYHQYTRKGTEQQRLIIGLYLWHLSAVKSWNIFLQQHNAAPWQT